MYQTNSLDMICMIKMIKKRKLFRCFERTCRVVGATHCQKQHKDEQVLFPCQKVQNFFISKDYRIFISHWHQFNKPAKSHGLLLNISVLASPAKTKVFHPYKELLDVGPPSEVFYFKFINITLMFRATKTDSILFCPSMDIWECFFGPEETLG